MQIMNSSLSNKTSTKVLDIPSQIEAANMTTSIEQKERRTAPLLPQQRYDTFTLIDNDFQLGKIDLDTKIKYYVFALFDENRLPSKYRSDQIAEDGTTVMIEIQEQFEKLKPQTQEELAGYNITRLFGSHGTNSADACFSDVVLPLASTSSLKHFRLHYTDSGPHAVLAYRYESTKWHTRLCRYS